MPHECTNCGRTFPDGSKEMLSGCPDCGGNKFQFAPAGRVTSGSTETATSTSVDSSPPPSTTDSRTQTSTNASGASGTVERAAKTVREWVSSESKRLSASARSEQSDRSWPDSDASAEADSTADIGEFEEWPETARRPEDRSSPSTDASSSGTRGGHAAPAGDAASTSDSTANAEYPARTGAAASRSESIDAGSSLADNENTAQADARSEVVSPDELSTQASRSGTRGPSPPGEAGRPAPVDADGDQPPGHGRVVSEPSGEQPSIEELRKELNQQFESIKILSPGQYELNLMELYNREEYIISLQEDGRYVIDVPDSWRSEANE